MKACCVVLLAFLLVIPTAGKAQVLNSKLKHKSNVLQKVLIMPAEINLRRSGLKGYEGMPDEADKLAANLTAAVSDWMAKHDVNLIPVPPADGTVDTGEFTLQQMQRKYDAIEPQILRRPKGVVKGIFSLQDDVAGYAPAGRADALVYIRGAGTLITRAERTMGSIPGPWMWATKNQRFDGRMAFVDARSGEILLFLEFSSYGYAWKGTAEELIPRIKDSMLSLPVPIHTVLGPPASNSTRHP